MCAMNISLPAFEDDFLNELMVCATFHTDSPSQLKSDESVRLQSKYTISEGTAWLRILLDSEDGTHGHLHFDIGRDSVYDELQSLETVDVSEVHKLVERFTDQAVDMVLSAEYSIPLDQLPARGMIRTLFEVGTESCGAYLSVDGASMSIDDDLFTKIRWYYNEKKDCIEVTLVARKESVIDDKYLEDVVELMRNGVECFIFETSEELRHATKIDETRAKA